ncbi:MAG TPA: glycoside hydrolase family 16 protein [Chitinivibrionales bacterium]|jgi:beta-glucanase (GH16 family)|nr:glycoside hydrolase family 16 protein [Chitinivibrionales bacterium]
MKKELVQSVIPFLFLVLVLSPFIANAADQPDPGLAFVPPGYTLVFSDEFNGDSISTDRWMKTNASWPGGSYGIEHVTTDGSNLVAGNGAITIEGKKDSSSGYFSAVPSFKHGYFESRIKMKVTQGSWPAYWLSSTSRWPPEWDIFEFASDSLICYQTPHITATGFDTCADLSSNRLSGNNNVYHIYGFLWTATGVTWYIDGKATKHCNVSSDNTDDFMWLMYDLAIGGSWPGLPNSSTIWPMTLTTDYSRVFQDSTGTIQNPGVGYWGSGTKTKQMIDPATVLTAVCRPLSATIQEKTPAMEIRFSLSGVMFRLPQENPPSVLCLYDIRGNIVAHVPVNGNTAVWRGTNTRGVCVPAGSYVARVTGGKQDVARAFVFVK